VTSDGSSGNHENVASPTPSEPRRAIGGARADLRHRLEAATKPYDVPLAVIEMDAWDANAADLVRRAGGTPIRVASKSVRSRELLRDVLKRDGFSGVLALTLPEALWLVGTDVSNDVLVGYPTADRGALFRLMQDEQLAASVTLTVDDLAQLDLIDAVSAPHQRETVRICLELDCSWWPGHGPVRIGARRSPLHSPESLARLARIVTERPGFRLVGILAYESQIAGVPDVYPGRGLYGPIVRWMKRRSAHELRERRAAAIEAVRAVADIEFVNGGGTGSLERTVAEDVITEVAAGSGLLAPRLFDRYRSSDRQPASFFALPVVRRPAAGVVTVLGGGYVASGSAGPDRLPVPWLPEGLRLDPREGAGEAQTPLLGSAADSLAIGDWVWFRHAKAGELGERFELMYLVRGERRVGMVTTYRGEGKSFL
jgi:D-serine deaminase-like pyridoxal phosphate-dependent protein